MELIDEGNTIPFIARYRKEATGSLDAQVLRTLNERLEYLRNLDKRREEILSAITEQAKMTPELHASIDGAKTLAELEDLYRPYRPKDVYKRQAQREAALCQKKDPQLRVEVEGGIKPGNAGTDDNHVEILLHSVSPCLLYTTRCV